MVFSKTKQGADRLVRYLENKGINAAAIHGDKSQAVRTKSLAEFKELSAIERLIKQLITHKIMLDFEPVNTVPESYLDTRPIKAKKAKKSKKPKRL